MKKITTVFIAFIVLVILLGGIIAYPYYKNNYASNVNQTTVIYIPTNATYSQVRILIEPYLKDVNSFDKVAESQKYPEKIKAGKYKINKGESNKEVMRKLYLGEQEDVHLRIKSYDDIYELASALGRSLESDSLTFINYFKKVASQKKLSEVEELKIYFTPDTYYVNWNTAPQDLFVLFEKIHNDFWTQDRIAKAKALGLNQLQVYTLASIVQREYMRKEELPIIASLYLNRYRVGMKLQSDPTVIYAERKVQGFKVQLKRVKNVSVDSPYNTYKYKGLPPLPICIPNDFVVDAVLNPAQTDYIFMCADTKKKGYHLFTNNAEQHMRNAKQYTDWLDSIGIK